MSKAHKKAGSQSGMIVSAPRWEEPQDFCNPDKLLLCPYDPHHLIRACRFPYHLIKCRKNHPELISELWTCPFNARHLMRKDELSDHILTCVDRCSVRETYMASVKTDSKFQIPVSTWTAPVCDEDWDEGWQDNLSLTLHHSNNKPQRSKLFDSTKCAKICLYGVKTLTSDHVCVLQKWTSMQPQRHLLSGMCPNHFLRTGRTTAFPEMQLLVSGRHEFFHGRAAVLIFELFNTSTMSRLLFFIYNEY
ncbi:gametocyte-specific factor 1 isoform X1 [Siphateles boraxobius]|uniref:gametocyte-specific factor 1 isoform X1 n=1 Tax=Siphateles boraxobius TaxID=180520 RepID=UPI004064B23A